MRDDDEQDPPAADDDILEMIQEIDAEEDIILDLFDASIARQILTEAGEWRAAMRIKRNAIERLTAEDWATRIH
jgi:hypothetical protein